MLSIGMDMAQRDRRFPDVRNCPAGPEPTRGDALDFLNLLSSTWNRALLPMNYYRVIKNGIEK